MKVRERELLTSEQQAIVHAAGGARLVVAGPGSGKTRTLVATARELVNRGVPPNRIGVVTFSRRAASEISARLDRSPAPFVGTLHALAARLLRIHAEAIGIEADFAVADASTSRRLLEAVLAETQTPLSRARAMREAVSRAIATEVTVSEYLTDLSAGELERFALVWQRFAERKAGLNLLDFDDLLLELTAAMRRGAVPSPFEHLLVDELQDLTRSQLTLVELLGSAGNLVAVGDPRQAIYAFRGAEPDGFAELTRRVPTLTTHELTTNFRSSPAICAVADRIRAGAGSPHPDATGPPVRVVRCDDPEHEAAYVVGRIAELVEAGTSVDDVAILCRLRRLAGPFERQLATRGMVVHRSIEVPLFAHRDARAVVSGLRALDNPSDLAAVDEMLSALPGASAASTSSILRQLEVAEDPLGVLESGRALRSLPRPAQMPFRGWVSMVRRLHEATPEETVVALTTWWEQVLGVELAEPARRALDDLRIWSRRYDTVAALVADLGLMDDPSGSYPDERSEPGVTISTIHQAKGRQWDAVFVVGLCEGQLPSNRAGDLNEEARLLFVATTRAARHLTLSWTRWCDDVRQRRRHAERSRLLDVLEGARPDVVEFVNYQGPDRDT